MAAILSPKKIILSFLLAVPLFLSATFTPAHAKKMGINIGSHYDEFTVAADTVESGGWVVTLGGPGNCSDFQAMYDARSNVNIVIRGYCAGACFGKSPEDAEAHAKAWAATLGKLNTGGRKIFFMPWNEPFFPFESQGCNGSNAAITQGVVSYIQTLQTELTAADLFGSKVHLLTPMFNQFADGFEEHINDIKAADPGFFNRFHGAAMNLYGEWNGSGWEYANGKKDGTGYRDYVLAQVYGNSSLPVYAIETGVGIPGGNPFIQYSQYASHIANYYNSVASLWKNDPNFKMFAIFSYDPHDASASPNWIYGNQAVLTAMRGINDSATNTYPGGNGGGFDGWFGGQGLLPCGVDSCGHAPPNASGEAGAEEYCCTTLPYAPLKWNCTEPLKGDADTACYACHFLQDGDNTGVSGWSLPDWLAGILRDVLAFFNIPWTSPVAFVPWDENNGQDGWGTGLFRPFNDEDFGEALTLASSCEDADFGFGESSEKLFRMLPPPQAERTCEQIPRGIWDVETRVRGWITSMPGGSLPFIVEKLPTAGIPQGYGFWKGWQQLYCNLASTPIGDCEGLVTDAEDWLAQRWAFEEKNQELLADPGLGRYRANIDGSVSPLPQDTQLASSIASYQTQQAEKPPPIIFGDLNQPQNFPIQKIAYTYDPECLKKGEDTQGPPCDSSTWEDGQISEDPNAPDVTIEHCEVTGHTPGGDPILSCTPLETAEVAVEPIYDFLLTPDGGSVGSIGTAHGPIPTNTLAAAGGATEEGAFDYMTKLFTSLQPEAHGESRLPLDFEHKVSQALDFGVEAIHLLDVAHITNIARNKRIFFAKACSKALSVSGYWQSPLIAQMVDSICFGPPVAPWEFDPEFPDFACNVGVKTFSNFTPDASGAISNPEIPTGPGRLLGRIILQDKASKVYYDTDVPINPGEKAAKRCGGTPPVAIEFPDGTKHLMKILDPVPKMNHVKVDLYLDPGTYKLHIGDDNFACYHKAEVTVEVRNGENACVGGRAQSTLPGGVSCSTDDFFDWCGVNYNLRLNNACGGLGISDHNCCDETGCDGDGHDGCNYLREAKGAELTAAGINIPASCFMCRDLFPSQVGEIPCLGLLQPPIVSGWQEVVLKQPINEDLIGLECFGSEVCYALSENGLYKTSNGWESYWRVNSLPPITGAGNIDGYLDMDFTSNLYGWVVGGGHFLAVTNDGGMTWKRDFLTGLDKPFWSVHVIDNQHIIFGQSNGDFVETKDGGISWTRQKPVGFNQITTSFADIGGQLLLAGNSGGVASYSSPGFGGVAYGVCQWARFDDEQPTLAGQSPTGGGPCLKFWSGGTSWNSYTIKGANQPLKDVALTSGQAGWAVGARGTLLKSEDGLTWEKVDSPTSQNLNAVDFADLNTGYAVGDGGVILKYVGEGTSTARPTEEDDTDLFSSAQP